LIDERGAFVPGSPGLSKRLEGCYHRRMLNEFASSLYVAEGPVVPFFGFPYPTRMAVVKLTDGKLWVWSPIALTEKLAGEVEALGVVRYVVAPNKLHHLFLSEWMDRWPEAAFYASPGLASRRADLHFQGELGDYPPPAWAAEIDQVLFHGSFFMTEAVFFHKLSKTAIFCDLIQRHTVSSATGWKGLLMKLDGLVGKQGGTPREWRASFYRRNLARKAREQVMAWGAERLLIAHGECAFTDATAIIGSALRWI